MKLARLLRDLGRAGVELQPRGDRLRHRPAELPPDLSARLRAHKLSVLGILTVGQFPGPHTDTGYVLAERLGVADELGLATRPGAPAWMVAVGEAMGEPVGNGMDIFGTAAGPSIPTTARWRP